MILASKSPRRLELLRLITTEFTVQSADVDETLPDGIDPRTAVCDLSLRKALPFRESGEVVLGADTVVALGGEILGKPASADDAFAMLKKLSGKTHTVLTGVTVLHGTKQQTFCSETAVRFLPLTDETIRAYIATGEPFDKAGGYGIQGKGALLVESICGDYCNVVGLPVSKLNIVLRDFV